MNIAESAALALAARERGWEETDSQTTADIVLEMKPFGVKEINKGYKTDLLLPPTLDTKGWKFSREEANER